MVINIPLERIDTNDNQGEEDMKVKKNRSVLSSLRKKLTISSAMKKGNHEEDEDEEQEDDYDGDKESKQAQDEHTLLNTWYVCVHSVRLVCT